MEVEKNAALRSNKFNFDANMCLSNKAKTDLEWLRKNLEAVSAPIRSPKPDYVIHTDASNKGWGGFDPQTDKKNWGEMGLGGAETAH